MGVVVSETNMETAMATLRVTANSRKRRPTMPGNIKIGMKTATSEALMERTEADLFGTEHGGGERLHAAFHVACDIFDDDDGVVDYEAGGDGKGHERQVVEAVAAEVHDAESADK